MLRKNLALATIVTAPSPATTGLSLVVDTGEAARFPVPATDGDFYATLFPANEIPHIGNSEIVKVTAVSSDTFTIVRAQRGSTAKTVEAGWLMIQGIYAEDFDDLATKEYVNNLPQDYGGWLEEGLDGVIVTRESTDDPTVVLRFDADVRDYIWKGMRIKATENSIVHYFIVSAEPTDDSGDTLVTCLSEIDTSTPTQAKNLIGATTISNVAYAPPKTYPKGFPISPDSWTMRIDNLTEYSMSSGGVWSTATPLTINLAGGDWRVLGNVNWAVRTGTTGHYNLRFSFQDDEGTPSDQEVFYLRRHYFQSTGSGGQIEGIAILDRHIQITSKTTFYIRGNHSSDNVFRINNAGAVPESFVKATSTLL